jgi:PadR family transcriptional regulator PadR
MLYMVLSFIYIFAMQTYKQMKIENTTAQMRKGILEFCILSLISGHDLYTSEILEALKKGKMLVVEGTVYPLLTRLKNADLLHYRWEESSSGPPRKYYSLTPKGEAFLSELQKVWSELNKAVKIITQNKNNLK